MVTIILVGVVLHWLIETYSIRVISNNEGISINYEVYTIDSDRNYYYEHKTIWLWKK